MPNFLTKLFGNASEKAASNDGWVSYFGAGSGGGLAARITDRSLMDADKNWVYVSVDRIAASLSEVPYKLMKYNKQGDDEEVIDHAVLDFLEDPHPLFTGTELLYHTIAHLELTGNAYWLFEEGQRNPKQMMLLLPEYTKAIMDKAMMSIKGYNYRIGSFNENYDVDQILHVRYPNPRNLLKGRGTLAQIAEWVDVDSYATEFNRKFFINGGSPGGTLETEATDKKALELIKTAWEMKYRGASNAHRVSVLPKGTKYNEPKNTQKDMEFNQSLITTRNNILAAFGVPKSVVGISETGDSRSDAEAAHYAFMFFTIKPKLKRMERFINKRLLPMFDGTEQMYIKFDDPVPENKTFELDEKKAAGGGKAWMTVNEIRAEDGLPPLEGGDELDKTPSTVPVEPTKAIKRAPYRRLVAAKKTADAKEDTSTEISSKVAAALFASTKRTQVDIDEEKHKTFVDRTEKKVDKLADNFKDHDRKIKQQILTDIEDVQDPQDLKTYTKAIGDKYVDRKEAIAAIIEFTDPIFQELVKTEGAIRYNEIEGATGNFDAQNPSIQKYIKRSMKLMAESYTDTTLKILSDKLSEAISAGDSMVEIRNTVAEVFDFTEKYRARTVAHTETFRVANAAGREAFKQSGVVETVKWHTAEDERVCEFCGPMNGKIVGVDDAFFKKGDRFVGADGGVLELTYDDTYDPPLHVNCRCFTLPETIDIGEASAEDLGVAKAFDDDFVAELTDILKDHED